MAIVACQRSVPGVIFTLVDLGFGLESPSKEVSEPFRSIRLSLRYPGTGQSIASLWRNRDDHLYQWGYSYVDLPMDLTARSHLGDAMATIVDIERLSEAEQRADLAAAFRWTARLDMHEGVANHFSLAVSDDGKRFLMNPDARHFSRIKASELLLLDADDPETMNRPDAPDPTAWCIHGRIHALLPHARCVLHVHPKHATVLACLEDSTIHPIDQTTARFFETIAVDDGFTGMALGDEEGARLAGRLGDKSVLMMGNHGVMVVGENTAQAFDTLYYLERAAETMVMAYMTGQPLRILADDVARRTAEQWANYPEVGDKHFAELKRMLDEDEPDFRQ